MIPKINRKVKRLIAFETKRNKEKVKNLERQFSKEILSIDASTQSMVANLEDSIYNDIYKKYLARFVTLIESMVEAGCFKYTVPNKEYFKKLYNPIDGTKITNTDD